MHGSIVEIKSFSVPPLGNLPQWPRIGSLHKAHFPRPLPRDRLQPLPNPPRVDSRVACEHGDVDTKVASLERDINFLQQQHKETLEKLHDELDGLKRENKELHYKLIMDPPLTYRKVSSRRAHQPKHREEPEPQGDVSQEEAPCESPHSQTDAPSSTEHSDGDPKRTETPTPSMPNLEPPAEPKGGLITSLQPLRIHCSPSQPPRAPTLQECEVIIRQLYNANSLQSQEILRMKAILKDIMLNKRISPEAYIMTKTNHVDSSSQAEENERFPKLRLKPLPKVLEGSRLGLAERVILPSLKHGLAGSETEQQKRAPAMQRGRLRRTVL